MKKVLLTLALLISILGIITNIFANNENSISFDDVNTINFIKKTEHINVQSIKKICSYDYCDYLMQPLTSKSIEHFTENYLHTIKDEEEKSILKIKGIKITKIILD